MPAEDDLHARRDVGAEGGARRQPLGGVHALVAVDRHDSRGLVVYRHVVGLGDAHDHHGLAGLVGGAHYLQREVRTSERLVLGVQARGVADLGDDHHVAGLLDLGRDVSDRRLRVLVVACVGERRVRHVGGDDLIVDETAHGELHARLLVGVRRDEKHVVARLRAEGQDAVLVAHDGDGVVGHPALDGAVLIAAYVCLGVGERLDEGRAGRVVAEDAAVLLQGQDARDGGVQLLVGDGGIVHDVLDELLEHRDVGRAAHDERHEGDVHAGLEGALDGIGLAEVVGDGLHVQGVGDAYAPKAHLGAQDVGHEHVGERGGQVDLCAVGLRRNLGGLYLRVLDVRGHDHVYAVFDGGPEGDELEGLELILGLVDERQTRVRVGGRVTVAGEVLGGSGHVVRLDALHHGNAQLGDELRVAREGAQADDGVVGVVVGVEHGREVDIDVQRVELATDDLAAVARVLGAARGAHCHVARQGRAAA